MTAEPITLTTFARTALRSSWHDALLARYQLDQARLRVSLEDCDQDGEHL